MQPRGSFRGRSNMQENLQTARRARVRQGRGNAPAGNQETPAMIRLLKMIVSTLQPLEITEDTEFVKFVGVLDSSLTIPRRSELRSQLLEVYTEKKRELRSILASADDVVLTCERWSSRAEDSYLTVGCHFVDIHGKLNSYVLKTTSLFGDESGTNIQNHILAVMEAWGIKRKVHNVIQANMPQLKRVRAKWTLIPCFADTLNVIFKSVMSADKLSNVLRKCQNIVRFFKCDSEAARKLREVQKQLNMRQEQDRLVVYSGERWLPCLNMLEQLLHQHSAMVMVLDERGETDFILSKDEKEKVKNIVSALKHLRDATSAMKTGFVSISAMLPLLSGLMEGLGKEKRQNSVARALLSKSQEKFGDINNHWLALNTFLDPRLKKRLGDQNKRKAMREIMKELAPGPASSFGVKLKGVLNRYEALRPAAGSSNPLSWWRQAGKEHFEELSELALKKLGIVSTAVPSERAFSSAGDRFHHLRNAIDPENLDVILFLNSNWSPKSSTQNY